MTVIADDINQSTTPTEYAFVVYDMYADYFIYNYKKLTKEIFEKAKEQLDIETINSYPFPGTFDDTSTLLMTANT